MKCVIVQEIFGETLILSPKNRVESKRMWHLMKTSCFTVFINGSNWFDNNSWNSLCLKTDWETLCEKFPYLFFFPTWTSSANSQIWPELWNTSQKQSTLSFHLNLFSLLTFSRRTRDATHTHPRLEWSKNNFPLLLFKLILCCFQRI